MGMSPRLLRPRAGSGFEPTDLANIALWLDGADESTLGAQTTGPGGVSNNGPVRYWGDKSGNGYHATNNANISTTPTLNQKALAGKSFLGFDGGDSIWGGYGAGLAMPKQTTFAAVRYNSSSTPSFGRLFAQLASGDAADSSGYIPFIRNGTTNNIGGFRGGVRAAVTMTSGSWAVLQTRFFGPSIDTRINLGSYTVDVFGGSYSATFVSYFVGANDQAGGAAWADAIAECIVYSDAITDADADKVTQYLMKKYGIS